MTYGISCWPYGDSRACDCEIEEKPNEGHETFMERAGRAGWVIGHYDGEAYYCCPSHKDAVWDASRLRGFFTYKPFSEKLAFKQAIQRYERRPKKILRFRHTKNFRFITVKYVMPWAEQRRRERELAKL